jgi:hypothetical protein
MYEIGKIKRRINVTGWQQNSAHGFFRNSATYKSLAFTRGRGVGDAGTKK